MQDITRTRRPVILTGDRPTGPLHLGHHAGSLGNRVRLQRDHEQYVLVADAQALTDNGDRGAQVRDAVVGVVCDYLAVGIDPALSTICLQSALPDLAELTTLYQNLVSVGRLERNPTIREEMTLRGYERDVPVGFLSYPVAQAADITAFKAELVPAGADQLPMVELSNEVAHRVNRIAGREVLPMARALVPAAGRLPGVDGKGKASKSMGNAIALGASEAEVDAAVHMMYTDPDHLRRDDPGRVEGNVVFAYLDAFDADVGAVEAMKAHYRRGGVGDATVKARLKQVLREFLGPVRERRHALARRPDDMLDVLRDGTAKASTVTGATLQEVREGLGILDLRKMRVAP